MVILEIHFSMHENIRNPIKKLRKLATSLVLLLKKTALNQLSLDKITC